MLRTGARFLMKTNEILRMLRKGTQFRTGAQFYSRFSGCSARERDFERKNDEILRMLDTGARFLRFCWKFSRCSARERDFVQNSQDAPHGSALFSKMLRMLRTGTRFYQNYQDAPHGSAFFVQIFNMLRTGAILNHGVANTIPKLYRRPPLKRALLNQENEVNRDSFGIELV